MTPYLRRLAGLLCPLVMLTACGSSGQQQTARLLDDRLQNRLAPDVSAGRAAFEPLPDGARVTLLKPLQFSNTADAMDDRQSDVRSSLVEGLLDPTLMRIQVADTSSLPDSQREMRVRNVSEYLTAYGLGPSLQPADPLQAAPASSPGAPPAGIVITIGVQCPNYNDGSGYRGLAKPACN